MAHGKGKAPAKQGSLRAAGLLPTLKKPAEAVGMYAHIPGDFWEKCPAADKKKIYASLVRTFEAVHKFAGGQPPSAAFECQEMGEEGTGSLELGVASGEVFWVSYPQPFLKYFYDANPNKLPGNQVRAPRCIASRRAYLFTDNRIHARPRAGRSCDCG